MRLCKEIYRDQSSTARKEIFYNEHKKIIGILETIKGEEGEGGTLHVYEYSGENLRIIRYGHGTNSYATFLSKGHQILGEAAWHTIDEAWHILEEKYEKGLLINEQSHNVQYNIKTTVSYEYKDGLKVAEKKITEEGTVVRSVFTYKQGLLESKTTFNDEKFSEQFMYIYGENRLLAEEQKMLKYKDTQYLSQMQKFFYNDRKEIKKTEYYGRYDGRMILYKVEEKIWQGNKLTEKGAFASNADYITGYYDMDALYTMFREAEMEWQIPHFDKQYLDKLGLDIKTKLVKEYDHMNKEVAIEYWNAELGEMLTRMVYRNEYNEQSLLEFIISYAEDEGKLEERDIRKYYYCA